MKKGSASLLDNIDWNVAGYIRLYNGPVLPQPDVTSMTLVDGGTVEIDLEAYQNSLVKIEGGSVSREIEAHGSSIISVQDGQALGLYAYDQSYIDISGGRIFWNVKGWQYTRFDISAGTIGHNLESKGNCRMTITGGVIGSRLEASQNARIELHGGSITNELWSIHSAHLSVYGDNFALDGIPLPGGTYSGVSGQITGSLSSGDLLDCSLRVDSGASITLVIVTKPIDVMLKEVESIISDLPENVFKNNASQRITALNNKIEAIIEILSVAESETDPAIQDELYLEAIDKLENDIMAKMDGCYGGNLRNDWITDCATQAELFLMIGNIIDEIADIVNNN